MRRRKIFQNGALRGHYRFSLISGGRFRLFVYSFLLLFSLSMRWKIILGKQEGFDFAYEVVALCSLAHPPCGCRSLRLAPLQPTFTSCFASLLPSPHSLAHSLPPFSPSLACFLSFSLYFGFLPPSLYQPAYTRTPMYAGRA